MATRKRNVWAQPIGSYGSRIRLSEDPQSGIIQAEMRDPTLKCGYRQRSLGHRDRKRAIKWAYRQLAKLADEEQVLRERTPTLKLILDLYRQHQSPKKCRSEQQGDGRRSDMWGRFLGERKDLRRITRHLWDSFITLRGSGAIDSRGNAVDIDSRKPVRDATVAADLIFLRSVLRWATRWQSEDGRYLLAEDVTRGFEIPIERNPRRPVATVDRYEAIMAVADQVMTRVEWSGERVYQRSFLGSVLTLVHHTGRRVSAVLKLRFEDLKLDQGPHGSICWPAHSDKIGRETVVPVSLEVRETLNQIMEARPGIGAAPIFPAAKDPSSPISIDRAREWLIEGERLAGLKKMDGSLWHAYRRGWATSRKHLPDVDVAFSGGWINASTLRDIYQQPDDATLFRVVSEPTRIEEAK